MNCTAIILSGGIGTRLGLDIPKQYVEVESKPILRYCFDTFSKNKNINQIIIVCADEWIDYVRAMVKESGAVKQVYYTKPGKTRQYSIYNGLKTACEISEEKEHIVIIHDAARPLVSNELINRCIEGCKEADAVMPVIPVKDTTYLSTDGKHINALLDRSQLWAGQAPEAFRLIPYIDIHNNMSHEELMKINGSTEIAFKGNLNCIMIEGDPMNFKITTPDDLSNFSALISNQTR